MAEDVRIGVDIGGTFTDVVSVQDGRIAVTKTPSTPTAPEEGVVTGLKQSRADSGFAFEAVGFLAHGTTVATNAVLEREWAPTALVTTEGFRDALEIGRQTRPSLYDFQAEKPAPVVERDRRFEVTERIDERGNVVTSLDTASVEAVATELSERDIESVAISLLFAFENDEHERAVKSQLEAAGIDTAFSLSSTVLPEIREYERTLATALNAGLKPVMDEYVGNLDDRRTDLDIPATLKIMQSNGGVITADVARERPVNTLLSGPAAGVQGAAYIGDLIGLEDIVTMDMGGTSCDVSLVQGGEPVISTEIEVGEYPVSVPMIDIHTIGAGGGSIAWIDAGDALRVGPRSAGADPGPICYGRGGTEPTITDAQVVLGRIDPANFLSDELAVDADAVERGIRERIATPLGMDLEEAAQGILDVANANMERALRVVSVERGHDPREFGLVAFGGAGPLHAATIARELEIPRVVVPRTAGVLSALGLLISDILYDYSTSRVRRWDDVDPAELTAAFEEFEETGRERLGAEGLAPDAMAFERVLDMRYVGQSFELAIPAPEGTLDAAAKETIAERFHDAHERRYGHASPTEPVELVTVRLRARGAVSVPDLDRADGGDTVETAITEERPVVYDGTVYETRIYDRPALPTDASFEGPAVIEGPESTIVVHPDQHVTVDGFGNVIVEVTA
ncbi:MAG: hydantoinase/oxoprolinase family protein [Halobacteriales archaeon]